MKLGRVGVIVAARMGSTRLPGKALLPLLGIPMLGFLMKRLKPLNSADLVIATTTLSTDDALVEVGNEWKIPIFRGNPTNLVRRYCDAADHFGFDTVVRVTGDCPFVNAELVEWCLKHCASAPDYDLATTKGQFPVGLDAEIFPSQLMKSLDASALLTDQEREHLTLHLYQQKFSIERIAPPSAWPASSGIFTVDTRADYDLACSLVEAIGTHDFKIEELLAR